jgi:hypothetical protein
MAMVMESFPRQKSNVNFLHPILPVLDQGRLFLCNSTSLLIVRHFLLLLGQFLLK